MANQTDRLTIYLENGKIVNVVSEDPNRVINDSQPIAKRL